MVGARLCTCVTRHTSADRLNVTRFYYEKYHVGLSRVTALRRQQVAQLQHLAATNASHERLCAQEMLAHMQRDTAL